MQWIEWISHTQAENPAAVGSVQSLVKSIRDLLFFTWSERGSATAPPQKTSSSSTTSWLTQSRIDYWVLEMVKMQYLRAIGIITNLWVVMGNLVMGQVSAAPLPLLVQKNSPGNNHERKRFQIKITRSLHGIKRGCRRENFLRACTKVVEGSESYCS